MNEGECASNSGFEGPLVKGYDPGRGGSLKSTSATGDVSSVITRVVQYEAHQGNLRVCWVERPWGP